MKTSEDVRTCKKPGCTNGRYARQAICSDHKNEYQRNWRAEHPGSVRQHNLTSFSNREGTTYLHSSGYVKYVGFDHPACNASGLTNIHRLILWDKVDGKSVPCAECGEMLRWDVVSTDLNFVVGDHVDENKLNNDPSNIEPVHAACNVKRAFKNAAKRKAAIAAQLNEEELSA